MSFAAKIADIYQGHGLRHLLPFTQAFEEIAAGGAERLERSR